MTTVVVFTGGDEPLPTWAAGELPDDAYLIAADAGLDHAHRLGVDPHLLVGDLDSVTAEALDATAATVRRHPVDKDATDLELALAAAAEMDPDRIVVLGGQGGRFDHLVATVDLLASERWAATDLEWVSDRARVRFVRAGVTIHGAVGSTLTLLARGGPAEGVTTSGLRWDLNTDTLLPGHTRGVSNVFTSPVATLRLHAGLLVAIQPDPS